MPLRTIEQCQQILRTLAEVEDPEEELGGEEVDDEDDDGGFDEGGDGGAADAFGAALYA